MIADFFDVMRIHGEGAFENLSEAWILEIEIKRLKEIISNKSRKQLLSNWEDIIHKNDFREKQIKVLCRSVILFQASMESIIYNAYNRSSKLPNIEEITRKNDSFKYIWKYALNEVNADNSKFIKYHKEIYKKYRNPIIHTGRKSDIKTINSISFKDVYIGIRNGWDAFKELYKEINKNHYDNSWKIMCNKYSLPDLKEVINL